jgi:hypothetical protein
MITLKHFITGKYVYKIDHNKVDKHFAGLLIFGDFEMSVPFFNKPFVGHGKLQWISNVLALWTN